MTSAQQIDTTSCERILQYLERGGRITGVVEVRDPTIKLATLGDMFLNEDPDNVEQVKGLFRDKKIILFRNRKVCRTPLQNAVHCLRLEPYYLIKNLNKLYI